MLIEINSDDIKSIDQDYKGSKFYHEGEKVKVINPSSKHYGETGVWQGVASDFLLNAIHHNIELD